MQHVVNVSVKLSMFYFPHPDEELLDCVTAPGLSKVTKMTHKTITPVRLQ